MTYSAIKSIVLCFFCLVSVQKFNEKGQRILEFYVCPEAVRNISEEKRADLSDALIGEGAVIWFDDRYSSITVVETAVAELARRLMRIGIFRSDVVLGHGDDEGKSLMQQVLVELP